MLLYGQVERQKPRFHLISSLSLSLSVCTWFCVTSTPEFRLSHVDIYSHLHYSAPPPYTALLCILLLSGFEQNNPVPSPPSLAVPAAPKTRADRDHYCHRAQGAQVPVGQQSCTCFPLFLPFPSFSISLQSNHPTLTKALTQRNFPQSLICRCVCACLLVHLSKNERSKKGNGRVKWLIKKTDLLAD